MTISELNAVRNLYERKRDVEWHLADLRQAAENLVPERDGMPHGTTVSSRVEGLALKIVELGKEIIALCEQMNVAAARLSDALQELLHGEELRIMTLRYVACKRWLEIFTELKISDARGFHIHRIALKKVKQSKVSYSKLE